MIAKTLLLVSCICFSSASMAIDPVYIKNNCSDKVGAFHDVIGESNNSATRGGCPPLGNGATINNDNKLTQVCLPNVLGYFTVYGAGNIPHILHVWANEHILCDGANCYCHVDV